MTDDLLVRGRAAYGRWAWGDAYASLVTADERDTLAADDLDRLATAAHLTGRVEAAGRAWERAHREFVARGRADRAARCAFWLGLTLLLRGEHALGGGWLARAGRVLADAGVDCVEHGYLRIPAALGALEGDTEAAYAAFEEILAIGERFGDRDLIALGRLGRGQALVARGEATRGAAMLDEAMLAVTTGDVSPVAAGIVYCAVIVACRQVFDLRRAVEWTAALSRWCAAQQDLKPYQGQCLVHRSEIMQLRGEWTEAMAEVRQACEQLSDPPGDPVLGMALYQQAELFRLRGDLAGAEECYQQASGWGHAAQPGMALLRLAQGRLDDAMGAIRWVVEAATGPVNRAKVLAAHSEIALAAGDTGAAREAADELGRIAEEFASPYLRAVVGYAQGAVLLAEGDIAVARATLQRAWAAWHELAAPYEAARAQMLLGLACMRLGDADTASLEWTHARRVFEELGAAPDLARLDALGGPSSGAGGLTGREVQVLALVAGGKTNREIATDLVLSEHTVRRHLQNIFRKLDLPSRAAATSYAHRHGLV